MSRLIFLKVLLVLAQSLDLSDSILSCLEQQFSLCLVTWSPLMNCIYSPTLTISLLSVPSLSSFTTFYFFDCFDCLGSSVKVDEFRETAAILRMRSRFVVISSGFERVKVLWDGVCRVWGFLRSHDGEGDRKRCGQLNWQSGESREDSLNFQCRLGNSSLAIKQLKQHTSGIKLRELRLKYLHQTLYWSGSIKIQNYYHFQVPYRFEDSMWQIKIRLGCQLYSLIRHNHEPIRNKCPHKAGQNSSKEPFNTIFPINLPPTIQEPTIRQPFCLLILLIMHLQSGLDDVLWISKYPSPNSSDSSCDKGFLKCESFGSLFAQKVVLGDLISRKLAAHGRQLPCQRTKHPSIQLLQPLIPQYLMQALSRGLILAVICLHPTLNQLHRVHNKGSNDPREGPSLKPIRKREIPCLSKQPLVEFIGAEGHRIHERYRHDRVVHAFVESADSLFESVRDAFEEPHLLHLHPGFYGVQWEPGQAVRDARCCPADQGVQEFVHIRFMDKIAG